MIKSNRIEEEILHDFSANISSKPYILKTNDIEIMVWPEFIDSKTTSLSDIYVWAYHVRIENKGTSAVKLISRYWKIIDQNGEIQEVDGEGVIGQQPIISPGDHYQYSSATHLKNPSGIMSGHYMMIKTDRDSYQEAFKVTIPTFSLDVPSSKAIVN